MRGRKPLIVVVSLMTLIVGISLSVYASSGTSGAKVSARLPNAPEYACPEGQPAAKCAQLKLTCGNGVVDQGEDCKDCPFDAGCPSGLVCGNIGGGGEYACHYPAGLCLAGPAG